jgi:dethiobiotin synthetase
VIELCLTRMAQSSGRLLVIEAAGGIMSPLDETHTMLDLVQALRVPMLLVAGSYLGTISHTLTAAAVIAASAADLKAVVVSESPEGPAMGATLAALRRRLTVPVAAVTRGGAIPEGLVEEIAD